MKSDDTFNKKVKRMMDTPSEATIMYGVALLRPEADEPTTTGSNGKMHGAKTVSTPAMNEISRNVINIKLG